MKWIVAVALLLVIAVTLVKVTGVAAEIHRQSVLDEAQPADAIIVLGAAAYRGKPSPVLEARLKNALFLYLQGMAPGVISTLSAGADAAMTAATVCRRHLA